MIKERADESGEDQGDDEHPADDIIRLHWSPLKLINFTVGIISTLSGVACMIAVWQVEDPTRIAIMAYMLISIAASSWTLFLYALRSDRTLNALQNIFEQLRKNGSVNQVDSAVLALAMAPNGRQPHVRRQP